MEVDENKVHSNADMSNLFRAPAARAIKILDRSLFAKALPTTAALVSDNRLLSKYRKNLEETDELLQLQKLSPIVTYSGPAQTDSKERKCFLLNPKIQASDSTTWSKVLREARDTGDLELVPYTVDVDYDLWSYLDVMRSILPEEMHVEIPVGFNIAGHVGHLNLREQYLPYKNIIAQVILDKNPHLRTIINKVDDVGADNEFRTFKYELLAGPDDLLVEVNEAGCSFKFDYAKVYWNSKLGTEHERVVSLFKPGEVVADVMAGIGPFAVPAGKKGVFVWANDKNPESYKYLEASIQRNKVSGYVQPFNVDGHDFIREAADSVLAASKAEQHVIIKSPKVSRNAGKSGTSPPVRPPIVRQYVPPTISHFVMNLPASAIEFLHNFRGLYEGKEELFEPHTNTLLPMIHCHCFAAKLDNDEPLWDVIERIEREIDVVLSPGDGRTEGELTLHEVRDVAPNKRMFCASFRLPKQVAFSARAKS